MGLYGGKIFIMKEISVIEWFKIYFDKPNLKEEQLNPIAHFSLLWNLFEHTYFTDKHRLNSEELPNLAEVSCNSLSDEELNSIFNQFKKRYIKESLVNRNFNSLGLCKKLHGELLSNFDFCKEILISNNPTKSDMTKVVLLIIHRFRNNLFHGRKDPIKLNTYEKQFKWINNFLMHFIETTSKNDTINSSRYKTT